MQEQLFRIGERVLVDGSSSGQARTGVIRYYGPTQFREGQWVGIELDEPTGKNDGTVEGYVGVAMDGLALIIRRVAYFKCAKDYGLFVHPSKVSRMADSLVASMMGLNKEQQEPPKQGAETSTPATVPSSTAAMPAASSSSVPSVPASMPILPALSSLAPPPPPFQLSEVSAKIVELSREFGKENVIGSSNAKAAVNIIDELPSTVTMRRSDRFDPEAERNPLLLTPTKHQPLMHLLPMTPGSAARGGLAQELAKRQAEVNHIRRHVEPLLLSARAIVNDSNTSGTDQQGNLQAIVVKLIAHMRDYDKVISRYERQLSKILEHQNHSTRPANAVDELKHELELAKTRLTDAEERARSLEGRLAVAMRAGDQQERSMRNSTTALIQELSDEKAALEEKVLRLEAEASVGRGSTSSAAAMSQSVMVEELRRELEAARRESQRLAQMQTAGQSTQTTQSIGFNVHDDQPQLRREYDQLVADYRELTEAKFKEARYFEEQLRELKDQLAQAQSELTTQRAFASSLQEQIDAKLDAVYDSGKRGSAQVAQMEAKLVEAVQQVDSLRSQLKGAEGDKSRLETKCLDLQTQLTRAMENRRTTSASATLQPNNSAQALEEARKQIAALEAELLHHNDSLARQRDASKTAVQAGLAEMQATLREEQSRRAQAERRLSQVEHEKGLIEEELGRLRLSTGAAHPASPDEPRVQELKSQLAKKGPQTQQFARLASFFAALPRTLTRGKLGTAPVNLSGIREAYAGVKEGLDRLEAVHERAIDRLQGHPVMDAGEDVEKTPTISRRRPIDSSNSGSRTSGIQGKTLFSADLHDSSRGFSAAAPQFSGYKV
jgi:chromosome segregation ATPase